MVELFIVRHGETDTNTEGRINGPTTNLPLNKVGIDQVQYLRDHLDVKFDEIYTSPLKRAVETAEILNKENLKINKDNRLLEINHGSWDGLKLKETSEKYPDAFDDNHYETANYIKYAVGGETFDHVFERIRDFTNEMSKKGNEKILIVCHGFISRSFYKIATNIPDISDVIQPDNAGVSLYLIKPSGKPYLAYYNRLDNLDYPFMSGQFQEK